jgi:hypothetical protein
MHEAESGCSLHRKKKIRKGEAYRICVTVISDR